MKKSKILLITSLMLTMAFILSCYSEQHEDYTKETEVGVSSSSEKSGFVTDDDGQTYKTVVIGTQTWMAENLNYETGNSKCYNNKASNCEIYGRLYDWETAKNICPDGWHLPNDEDWDILEDYAKGENLKANSNLWISGRGTDYYDFNALPGGYYRAYSFLEEREVAGFWSATSGRSEGSAHLRFLKYNSVSLGLDGLYINNDMANVRCLKD